jgi:uncharacterized protein
MSRPISGFGTLLFAIGIALCGWFIGDGIVSSRLADRYVTVKGVSERDVRADIALWPLRFVVTDDDLGKAQQQANASKSAILDFLKRHGIDDAKAELQGLEVNDVLANPYRSGPSTSRYIVTQTIMVRSEYPEVVQSASQSVNELVTAGVVLSSSGRPGSGPTFLFTGLTALKPEMIAEATANARRAAEQFAQDSDSQLGTIRTANQGIFVILPRDRAPGITEGNQLNKTVRVVSTIQYYLDN